MVLDLSHLCGVLNAQLVSVCSVLPTAQCLKHAWILSSRLCRVPFSWALPSGDVLKDVWDGATPLLPFFLQLLRLWGEQPQGCCGCGGRCLARSAMQGTEGEIRMGVGREHFPPGQPKHQVLDWVVGASSSGMLRFPATAHPEPVFDLWLCLLLRSQWEASSKWFGLYSDQEPLLGSVCYELFVSCGYLK